jgi:hypothetical protein
MRQFVSVLAAALICGLAIPAAVSAQKFEDFKPGGYVPKDGYTPDPNKVMYVIFWHNKKRTNEFDHRAYYMNADGVNDTTVRKMKEMMEQRYPNLVVYVKETNERDVKALIEREQKRIKFIEKDWVDLKQPERIEPPKKLGDKARGYGYDENAPKTPAEVPSDKKQDPVIGVWEYVETTSLGDVFTHTNEYRADGTMVYRCFFMGKQDGVPIEHFWKREGEKILFKRKHDTIWSNANFDKCRKRK